MTTLEPIQKGANKKVELDKLVHEQREVQRKNKIALENQMRKNRRKAIFGLLFYVGILIGWLSLAYFVYRYYGAEMVVILFVFKFLMNIENGVTRFRVRKPGQNAKRGSYHGRRKERTRS